MGGPSPRVLFELKSSGDGVRVGLVEVRGGAEVAPYMGMGKLWARRPWWSNSVVSPCGFTPACGSKVGSCGAGWFLASIRLRSGQALKPCPFERPTRTAKVFGGVGKVVPVPFRFGVGLWRWGYLGVLRTHISKARCGAPAVWLVQTLATCPAYANLKGYPPLIVLN
jgi:hypothetical protein